MEKKNKWMDVVPNKIFKSYGYGNISVAAQQWGVRLNAVERVLNILDNNKMSEYCPLLSDDIRTVKNMFLGIATGNQWDWFTTARMLGYPSSELSKKISIRLFRLIKAMQSTNDGLHNRSVQFLNKHYTCEMLDNYLDIAKRNNRPVEEDGWAYILWSSSIGNELYIGVTDGNIDSLLDKVSNMSPGDHPYGILGAWMVNDCVNARKVIGETLNNYHIGSGYYEMPLGQAKDCISQVLSKENIHALSPWHVNAPENNLVVAMSDDDVQVQPLIRPLI